jgi:ankyrin repeat protein
MDNLLLMSDAVQLVDIINDQNMFGDTILSSCAQRQQSAALMAWLIDEKGANVHGTTRAVRTALHKAASREGVSFLLARGLDATALDNDGWTPLMVLANDGHPEGMKRLLKEPKVVKAIDKQATGHSSKGATALHLACSGNE